MQPHEFVYPAILIAPFVASLMIFIRGGRRQVAVWGISGVVASVLATFSPGLVAAPLIIPAGLLLAAAATGAADQ